jgi:hypothetical protein
MLEFSPHLDVLPKGQRRLWEELSCIPDEFTLYGGTALALHLSEPSQTAANPELRAHLSENRPFVRNSPVSRATRGDTNIPR